MNADIPRTVNSANAMYGFRELGAEIIPYHSISEIIDQVTEEHAWREGEGDRSLEYWRKVHEDFLSRELATIDRSFNGKTKVVCEEFEKVFSMDDEL